MMSTLLNDFPKLSFDTEGKMRDRPENHGGILNILKAQNFLSTGFGMFAA